MRAFKWIKEWAAFCWAALWRPWRAIVTASIWLLGAFGIWRSEWLPTTEQEGWQVWAFIPKWDWRVWVICALVLTILVILFSVFEHHRRVCGELVSYHNSEREELGRTLIRATALLEKFNALPRLEGEIQDYVLIATEKNCSVFLRLFFVNTTPHPTSVKNFSLLVKTKVGTFEVHYPEEGDLKRIRMRKKEADEVAGVRSHVSETARLQNLVDFIKSKQVAELGRHVEGHLLFKVKGLGFDNVGEDKGMDFVVIATDAWGNNHELRKGGFMPRPSERIIDSRIEEEE